MSRERAAEYREELGIERFSVEFSVYSEGKDIKSEANQSFIKMIESMTDIDAEGYGYGGGSSSENIPPSVSVGFLIEEAADVRSLIDKVKSYRGDCRVSIVENEYDTISEEELGEL